MKIALFVLVIIKLRYTHIHLHKEKKEGKIVHTWSFRFYLRTLEHSFKVCRNFERSTLQQLITLIVRVIAERETRDESVLVDSRARDPRPASRASRPIQFDVFSLLVCAHV